MSRSQTARLRLTIAAGVCGWQEGNRQNCGCDGHQSRQAADHVWDETWGDLQDPKHFPSHDHVSVVWRGVCGKGHVLVTLGHWPQGPGKLGRMPGSQGGPRVQVCRCEDVGGISLPHLGPALAMGGDGFSTAALCGFSLLLRTKVSCRHEDKPMGTPLPTTSSPNPTSLS